MGSGRSRAVFVEAQVIPIGPVIDLASLDAALQHLAMLQSRIAEVRATAEATRQRANAYEAAETEADLEEISGITALVEPFAREQAKRQEEAGGALAAAEGG